MRSSEDGSEGSGATGGGSSNYKERGEFFSCHNYKVKIKQI